MKRSYRSITSRLLIVIYLLIAFNPLTLSVMQSKLTTHAVIGECSGDCRIDGCSHERSASHTCCCWQKKHLHDDDTQGHSASGCGKTGAVSHAAAVNHGSCCTLHGKEAHENGVETETAYTANSQAQHAIVVSSPPCGSGKEFTLLNGDTTNHLPFFYSSAIRSPEQRRLAASSPHILVSRPGDPPDPPPIITTSPDTAA